jgi:TRAP-type mannitol/chloroaromatic compound transport system permease small subunit
VRSLQRISAAIDRLNDRIGAAIQWIALVMVIVGSFNAIARYAGRYTGFSLSSNAYLELQWYLFSLIFLMGAAYGLNHDYHVRVDVLYARLGRRARAWINLIGSVLFLVPFAFVMLWISWGPVANSWAILETSPDPGGLPRYPIKTVILVSFFLLLLQAISQIVKNAEILAEPAGGPSAGPSSGSSAADGPGPTAADDPGAAVDGPGPAVERD